jgi:hypothetical protein
VVAARNFAASAPGMDLRHKQRCFGAGMADAKRSLKGKADSGARIETLRKKPE